jgi:hypothetical protein
MSHRLASRAAFQTDEPFYGDVSRSAKRLEIADSGKVDIRGIVPVAGQKIDFRHLSFGEDVPSNSEVTKIWKAHNRPISYAEHFLNNKGRLMDDL